jgi:hypothetical protein
MKDKLAELSVFFREGSEMNRGRKQRQLKEKHRDLQKKLIVNNPHNIAVLYKITLTQEVKFPKC